MDCEVVPFSAAFANRHFQNPALEGRSVQIVSDKQVAIKALFSAENISILVLECRNSLIEIGDKTRLSLVYIKGHMKIVGNKVADEVNRIGSCGNVNIQRGI